MIVSHKRHALVAALCTFMLSVPLVGCGQTLTAESPCSDYSTFNRDDQDAAVSKIAAELQAPNAVTPLGRPNIDYLCTNNQSMTLGEAIAKTG